MRLALFAVVIGLSMPTLAAAGKGPRFRAAVRTTRDARGSVVRPTLSRWSVRTRAGVRLSVLQRGTDRSIRAVRATIEASSRCCWGSSPWRPPARRHRS